MDYNNSYVNIFNMKNNELIANFMGLTLHADGLEYYDEHGLELGDSSKYHISWNALMPVVQECYKHKHENALLNAHCVFISAALETVNKKTIYGTVVNFIKAYN